MVALGGRGWRLAPSLAAMEREADRLAPRRSQRSDGSIGDWSHRLRRSHHNPSGGYVDAIDLTHDPRGGFDAHARARQVAARRDPRIEQIISNRQSWSHSGGWKRYWGINGHTSHVHFGVKRSSAGRSSTAGWWSSQPAAPKPVPPTSPPPPPKEFADMVVFWVKETNRYYSIVRDKVTQLTAKEFSDLVKGGARVQEITKVALWDKIT